MSPAPLSRRRFVAGGLAVGGLLAVQSRLGLASLMDTEDGGATERGSRLATGSPTRSAQRLVHADLHNHSHLSDGTGDAEQVFTSLRQAGLDVAALTDHSTVSHGAGEVDHCGPVDGDAHHGEKLDCRSAAGIDERGWRRTAELADAADEPDRFAAIRGFEWSSPALGHVNVWFSRNWIDPLSTAGLDVGALREAAGSRPWLRDIVGGLDGAEQVDPDGRGMSDFYGWLASDPDSPLAGGNDGIACFNHPGREPGRFSAFRYDPRVADRFVALEIMNRDEDFLFKGHDLGRPSPLVECLNAGWRVGLLGVTDEHGTRWGHPPDLGRAGLWVDELSRDGIRRALVQRRAFATFERGLRLDVHAESGAGGPQARMGEVLPHRSGPVTFTVDIARGEEWTGKPLQAQVLRPGAAHPEVAEVFDFRVPGDGQDPVSFVTELSPDDGEWVVVRIADPGAPNAAPGPHGHPGNLRAVAYASPFWLSP